MGIQFRNIKKKNYQVCRPSQVSLANLNFCRAFQKKLIVTNDNAAQAFYAGCHVWPLCPLSVLGKSC